VTSLYRPGGNITGVTFGSAMLGGKRFELLHELVPPPATIAWLRDPSAPSFEIEARDVEAAARKLGRNILSLNASSSGEIDAVFATIVQSRASRTVPRFGMVICTVDAGTRKAAIDATGRCALAPPFNLGNMLRANGHKVEAEAALRAATRADPMFAEAWYNLSDSAG
jgi:hypothetical protein